MSNSKEGEKVVNEQKIIQLQSAVKCAKDSKTKRKDILRRASS